VRASYDVPSELRIADAHSDLLLEVAWRLARGEQNPFCEHWLPQLERGGVSLQVCAIFVELEYQPEAALRKALLLAAAFLESVRKNEDRVVHVRSAADLDDERIGLVLALEGTEALGSSPELADVFWELGVRMAGLTWFGRNAFADGNAEPAHGGLSRLGQELVDRLVRLGVILDLAHASERTFWDVLERAPRAPVLVSHAGCRALRETPRNVSDGQLSALAERNGLLGLMAIPGVIDPEQPHLSRLVDHVDHASEVMGVEHVALGGDFLRQIRRSGAAPLSPRELRYLPPNPDLEASIDGLAGPEDYPNLVAALRDRGYGGTALEALLHANLERFLQRALPER
jgi:membrane dipeptidase